MKKYNLFLAVLTIVVHYNCTSPCGLYVEGGNKKLTRYVNEMNQNPVKIYKTGFVKY